MQDKWFRCIELPISRDQFHQLPRNAAYKYEYFSDKVYEWSMLWYWRNGFELLEYPGSLRRIRRQIREAT